MHLLHPNEMADLASKPWFLSPLLSVMLCDFFAGWPAAALQTAQQEVDKERASRLRHEDVSFELVAVLHVHGCDG